MGKQCPRCHEILRLEEFNKRRNGQPQPYCRECNKAYQRQWYSENKVEAKDKSRLRKVRQRKILTNYIGNYLSKHPCVHCGETNIVILEFDHKSSKEKDFVISGAISACYSLGKMIKEINKCQVLCCSCHRIKSQQDSGSWRFNFGLPE